MTTEDTEIKKEPSEQKELLLLPYYPPIVVDQAAAWYKASIVLMMSIEDLFVRKQIKKKATDPINQRSKKFEAETKAQETAKAEIDYWVYALEGAIKFAKMAYEHAPEEKYRKYLSRLEEMEV